ncbi:unnamed protein product [Dimorphilus gyrociliatus]|uniref:G-protein coupled receptors family 1 profile domain-containing protein n=1 Tax=Dimorphilus gyrociliatus TaxID=2664684 RepID=A0A7I8W1A3_9ANNE|nr:unnamed protein product [Dimorphilus gyrociliatus]
MTSKCVCEKFFARDDADMSNNTTSTTSTFSTASKISQGVYIGLLILLGVGGNSAVIFAIFKHLRFRSVTNAFILALAGCDLLNCSISMPIALAALSMNRLPDVACQFNAVSTVFSDSMSVFMVTLIGIDRLSLLNRQRKVSKKFCFGLIFLCCIISLTFSMPSAINSAKIKHHQPFIHCSYLLLGNQNLERVKLLRGVFIIITFALPFAVMLYSLRKLFKLAGRPSVSKITPASVQAQNLKFEGEVRTAGTVLIMITTTLLLRSPIIIASICQMMNVRIGPKADSTLILINWTASVVHPFTYAIRNPLVANLIRVKKPPLTVPPPVPAAVMDRSRRSSLTSKATGEVNSWPDLIFPTLRKISNISVDTSKTVTSNV